MIQIIKKIKNRLGLKVKINLMNTIINVILFYNLELAMQHIVFCNKYLIFFDMTIAYIV